ncbi:hypothetical protein I7I48_05107 [Histoplasma ohiense]|nr:hypothetical protein I7I48_05107 [Histoplasma ohiense (nom. inval.)]
MCTPLCSASGCRESRVEPLAEIWGIRAKAYPNQSRFFQRTEDLAVMIMKVDGIQPNRSSSHAWTMERRIAFSQRNYCWLPLS